MLLLQTRLQAATSSNQIFSECGDPMNMKTGSWCKNEAQTGNQRNKREAGSQTSSAYTIIWQNFFFFSLSSPSGPKTPIWFNVRVTKFVLHWKKIRKIWIYGCVCGKSVFPPLHEKAASRASERKRICCSDQMLQSAVMRMEQVTSHLSVTASEREREGGGGSSRDWRAITEMSYLHISKIHHRTAIKGPVNTVLHIERNFRRLVFCFFSTRAPHTQPPSLRELRLCLCVILAGR